MYLPEYLDFGLKIILFQDLFCIFMMTFFIQYLGTSINGVAQPIKTPYFHLVESKSSQAHTFTGTVFRPQGTNILEKPMTCCRQQTHLSKLFMASVIRQSLQREIHLQGQVIVQRGKLWHMTHTGPASFV